MRGTPALEHTNFFDGQALQKVFEEEMIYAVIHTFYDRVLSDELLVPIFDRTIAQGPWPDDPKAICEFRSGVPPHIARYAGLSLPAT
ncbi:hypothetical protein CQZ93_25515 [Ochrobactrum vermis]|nr:hypothetical protein CQZ93_25515 [Ochrobactrum vermis]